MEVKIQDNKMIITCDLSQPVLSRTGKTFLVFTTNGFQGAGVQVNGKPVSISINACIPAR